MTLANAADAMQYNPANLTRIDGLSMSFYRDPNPQEQTPFTSAAMSYRLSHAMTLGFEYSSFDHPHLEMETDRFERSAVGAAALRLGSEWAVGAEVNYIWTSDGPPDIRLKHFIVSAGASYTPEVLAGRLHAGLSFTNFSTPAHYELWNYMVIGEPTDVVRKVTAERPVPSEINLGADCAIVRDRSFDLTVSLGFTKGLEKYEHNSARSSFYALFTDWDDFPKYLLTQGGIGYCWKPLRVSRNVSYFQEMYLGYFSDASWFLRGGSYTHGARIGLDVSGVKASVGYAGMWHYGGEKLDVFYHHWLSESFQFDVSADLNTPGRRYDAAAGGAGELSRILVSGGYSFCTQIGKMKRTVVDGTAIEYHMPSRWSVESDFYLSDKSALTASAAYGHMNRSVTPAFEFGRGDQFAGQEIETLSLESGFRFHPLDAFHPFFIQASLGIIRFNPVDVYTGQRHIYYTCYNLTAGGTIALGATGFTLMPKLDFTTVPMENFPNAWQLGVFNQIGVGINIGYKL